MENENEMNAAAAENTAAEAAAPAETEKTAEETPHCCCENGVCSFEAPADAEAEKPCCCEDKAEGDAPCCCEDKAEGDVPCCCEEKKAERPVIPVTQEMLDDVRTKLATMLDFLSLDATVKAEAGNSKINLIISSEDAGRIIGRKGQSLESLQLLINRMMQKNDVNYPKIYIDIDGYSSGSKRAPGDRAERGDRPERGERRERRFHDRPERGERGDRGERRERRFHDRPERGERGDRGGGFDSHDENLRMMALDVAKEVRRWGDPKTLPEMNAHDRRIIHVALEKEADITTDSVGEEPHKSVVIALKK